MLYKRSHFFRPNWLLDRSDCVETIVCTSSNSNYQQHYVVFFFDQLDPLLDDVDIFFKTNYWSFALMNESDITTHIPTQNTETHTKYKQNTNITHIYTNNYTSKIQMYWYSILLFCVCGLFSDYFKIKWMQKFTNREQTL